MLYQGPGMARLGSGHGTSERLLAPTTSRSDTCAGGPASVGDWSYDTRHVRVEVSWRGSDLGSAQSLGFSSEGSSQAEHVQVAHGAGLLSERRCLVAMGLGVSAGCRFRISFRPGWASGPGAAVHMDAALHPAGSWSGNSSSAGGELGTGGVSAAAASSLCVLFPLPLH